MSRIDASPSGHIHRLPIWFRAVGSVAAGGATYLAGELTYEQTLLTWARGPQMVGFSLVHSQRLLVLLPCVVVLGVWILALVAWSGVARWRGARIAASRWVVLVLTVALLAIPCVPYGAWRWLFVNRLAKGPCAAEHLSYSAATGDLATVKALLDRGVDVNARNTNGTTALYGAAVEGQVAVIEYLLGNGADKDIRNSVGQSVVEAARSMNHADAVHLLRAHGAK
jgi:hypothetical protein